MPQTRKVGTMSVTALATFLREELMRQGKTQQWLEAETGIPDSTLSRILSANVEEPRASQLARIGKALGIDFWVLLQKAGVAGPPADPDEDAQQIAALVAGDPVLADVLREVSNLTPANRHAILAYIALLRQQEQSGSPGPPGSQ